MPVEIADASYADFLLLSANGATVAIWGEGSAPFLRLKIMDIATRHVLFSYPLSFRNPSEVFALSEDGKSVLLSQSILSDSNQTTQIFQWLALGQPNRVIWMQKNSDSRILAAQFQGRNVVLLRGSGIETRASSGRVLSSIALNVPCSSKETRCAALSSDAKLAAIGCGHFVQIFDVPTGKPQHKLQVPTDNVNRIEFSPHSKWLAGNALFGSTKADFEFRELIWNVQSGSLLWGHKDPAWPQRAYCNHDRALLTQEINSTDNPAFAWRNVQNQQISQDGPRPAINSDRFAGGLKFTRDEKMAAWLSGGKIWMQRFR